jgi:hypothetical protein
MFYIFSPFFGRAMARFLVVLLSISLAQVSLAQVAATTKLPDGASTKKIDEFLATLRPPTSFKALLSGNDLFLDVPDIAKAGAVRAKAVSTIARTDAMWLLSMHASPDSGNALFLSLQLDTAALPEVALRLQLYKTQPILLVSRASGKYYGLYREVKVGQDSRGSGGQK